MSMRNPLQLPGPVYVNWRKNWRVTANGLATLRIDTPRRSSLVITQTLARNAWGGSWPAKAGGRIKPCLYPHFLRNVERGFQPAEQVPEYSLG